MIYKNYTAPHFGVNMRRFSFFEVSCYSLPYFALMLFKSLFLYRLFLTTFKLWVHYKVSFSVKTGKHKTVEKHTIRNKKGAIPTKKIRLRKYSKNYKEDKSPQLPPPRRLEVFLLLLSMLRLMSPIFSSERCFHLFIMSSKAASFVWGTFSWIGCLGPLL